MANSGGGVLRNVSYTRVWHICSRFAKDEGDSHLTRERIRTYARPFAASALAACMLYPLTTPLDAQELVLGEATVEPGIVLIFEGAVRDHVVPTAQHLSERETDVHIEARANWGTDEASLPDGTPVGGFVGYLLVHAEITNETSGVGTFATLVPHTNLIDSTHYARNIALPGADSDLYTVTFYVNPPDSFSLALHRDWLDGYGDKLFEPKVFVYENVSFADIATAPPRPSASYADSQ